MTFEILDYIILLAAVVMLIVGLVKGFVNQLMGLVTVFVVTGGTALLYKHPEQWLSGISSEPLVVTAIAIVVTGAVLWLACWLVSKLLNKLVGKLKLLKAIDRILGAVLALAVVYCVVGALVAFLTIPSEFAQMLRDFVGDFFAKSWIIDKIYAVNPIGDMLSSFLGF